jgi:hypothetical protein
MTKPVSDETPSIAKARKTTEEANAVIAAEREARDAKTARLKALRLAKDAADVDKNPADIRPAERER